MTLSLRSRCYIADVWLGGYTRTEFLERVEEMNITPTAKVEAKLFWQRLELQLRLAPMLPTEERK